VKNNQTKLESDVISISACGIHTDDNKKGVYYYRGEEVVRPTKTIECFLELQEYYKHNPIIGNSLNLKKAEIKTVKDNNSEEIWYNLNFTKQDGSALQTGFIFLTKYDKPGLAPRIAAYNVLFNLNKKQNTKADVEASLFKILCVANIKNVTC
jgi:hypothetical protein